MLIYVCGIDKRCGILINFVRCPNLRKLWERDLPGMVKRKSDCRLTTSDFTACLGDKKNKRNSFCCLYPIGTFWGKTQRVCWGGGRASAGGDLRYPHVKQPNHSGETVREEGCHEVLPCCYRRFICLALSLPLFNPQRFWTLSGVKIFFCLERVPLITLADCTWGQLVYLLNESSISCTIWAMEW